MAAHYRKYQNQGPSYYGDLDEADETLLVYEMEQENNGSSFALSRSSIFINSQPKEWEDAYKTLAETLGLDADHAIPPIPRPNPTPLSAASSHSGSAAEKRKATENDAPVDTDMADGATTTMSSKRLKTDRDENGNEDNLRPPPITQLPPLLSVLQPSDVASPSMLTKQEMESVLLQLRKRAVLEEYLGDSKA